MERMSTQSGAGKKATSQDVVQIWQRVRAALAAALEKHPEAQQAVVEALVEEFGSDEAA